MNGTENKLSYRVGDGANLLIEGNSKVDYTDIMVSVVINTAVLRVARIDLEVVTVLRVNVGVGNVRALLLTENGKDVMEQEKELEEVKLEGEELEEEQESHWKPQLGDI
ncbi:hypothetical protein ACLOJK_035446 [Asimina triloba]